MEMVTFHSFRSKCHMVLYKFQYIYTTHAHKYYYQETQNRVGRALDSPQSIMLTAPAPLDQEYHCRSTWSGELEPFHTKTVIISAWITNSSDPIGPAKPSTYRTNTALFEKVLSPLTTLTRQN